MKTQERSEKYMHVFAHLKELRRRLFISLIGYVAFLIVSFLIYDYIVSIFSQFYSAVSTSGENSLYVNSVLEGFSTKIKVSLVLGLVLSMPVHMYNIIAFIFPALESKEKRWIAITLICSFVLMVIAAYLSYFKILPVSISFFDKQ